jgi:hypothetical protein
MSKTSYFLMGVIVTALVYMGAVRLHQWHSQRMEEQEIAAQNDGEPFTFQQVPVSMAAPEAELMQNPVKYRRPYPEIYLEDTPLTPEQQTKQAQDTIVSIVQDFQNEPALAKFNDDLQEASNGEVKDLVDLSTKNLEQILQRNPEIQRVVEDHSKDVNFAEVLNEIFQNPQFQQSVHQLQGGKNASKKPTAQ